MAKNDPIANEATWRDFQRKGANSDFHTLADMSNCDSAKAFAMFGDGSTKNAGAISPRDENPFSFVRIDQLEYIPSQCVVQNTIPENSLSLMFGASGSGKTFCALSIGLSVASGLPWFGHYVRRGDVLYICGEGRNGVLKRVEAWCSDNQIARIQMPFYVSQGIADFCDLENVRIINQAIRSQGLKPVLIIIDTLSRNISGDENDTKDMAAFIRALDGLKDNYLASVLIVHHTGHSEKKRARGSTVIKGALDAEYLVEKTGEQIKFTCTKMKDAAEPKPINFSLKEEIVNIGGFPEKSAVLEINDLYTSSLSPQEKAALGIIQDAHKKITYQDFVSAFVRSGTTSAKPTNLKRIIDRQISSLKEKNVLSENFEFLEAPDNADNEQTQ